MYTNNTFLDEEEVKHFMFEEEEEEADDDSEDEDDDEEEGVELESDDEEGDSPAPKEDEEEDELDKMSDEEIRAEAKKLREQKTKLINDLRKKEGKNRSLISKKDSEQESDEDGDEPDATQVLLERLESIEQRLANGGVNTNSEAVVGEALDAIYDTTWGSAYSPENDIDGENFKQLKVAYDMIKDRYPHQTKEEALQVLKRAHFIASPDAFEERAIKPAKPNMGDAGNLGGSSERGEKGGGRYTAEQAALARKFGNDPDQVYNQK